jgi:hypothetical protein
MASDGGSGDVQGASLLSLLDYFFHFARPQTARTDPNATGLALDADLHALDIRCPAAVCDVVRVANIVAERGAFRTDFAFLCHRPSSAC